MGLKVMKAFLRVFGILLVSFAIVIAVFAGSNGRTYTWFTSKVEDSTALTAATSKDIIEYCGIDSVNPETITVKRAAGMQSGPVVYFSVEGSASEYILNINPVRLNSDDRYELPIRLNMGLKQFIDLVYGSESDVIKGSIRIKYLNEYIDEVHSFTFDRQFLLDRFMGGMKQPADIELKDRKDDGQGYLSLIIQYAAESKVWDDVQWGADPDVSVQTIGRMSVIASPIGKLTMTKDQEDIINIVAPRLMEYIGGLNDRVDSLTGTLNEKLKAIEQLEKDNAKLKAALEDMTGKKSALEKENERRQQLIDQMNSEISKQKAELEALNDENGNLKKENAKQADTIKNMEKEAAALRESIQGLKSANDKLTRDNEEKDRSIGQLQKDKNSMQQTIDGLSNANSSLSSENSSLSADNSALREIISQLTKQLEGLQNEVSSLNSANAGLSSENSSLKSTIASLEKEIESLKQLLETVPPEDSGSGEDSSPGEGSGIDSGKPPEVPTETGPVGFLKAKRK